MIKKLWYRKIVILFLIFIGVTVIYGCKGSETRKVAEEVRDEVTGKRVVDQGERMKSKINDIQKQSDERIKNMKKQMGEIE